LDPSIASTFIIDIAFASITLRSFASFVGRLVAYPTDLDHIPTIPIIPLVPHFRLSIVGPRFLLALIEIHFDHLAVIDHQNFTNYLPIAFPTPLLHGFLLLGNPTVAELLVKTLHSALHCVILAAPQVPTNPLVVPFIFPLKYPIEHQLVVPARIVLPIVDLIRPYSIKLKFECFL